MVSLLVDARRCVVVLSFVAACGGADTQAPATTRSHEEPAPQPASAAPAPTTSPPTVETESWRPPLATLDVPEQLSAAQQQATLDCGDANHVSDPNVSAAQLAATAACMAAIPAPGREIVMHRQVITRFPDSPEARAALRAIGERYEQLGVLSQAMEHLADYARRYPLEPDARAAGQRAVCLALELSLDSEADTLLGELEARYGRRGFVRPTGPGLLARCDLVEE